jgi:hypothetical protein
MMLMLHLFFCRVFQNTMLTCNYTICFRRDNLYPNEAIMEEETNETGTHARFFGDSILTTFLTISSTLRHEV